MRMTPTLSTGAEVGRTKSGVALNTLTVRVVGLHPRFWTKPTARDLLLGGAALESRCADGLLPTARHRARLCACEASVLTRAASDSAFHHLSIEV